jgi:tetratricopeptide (TPR) repeat protein
MGEEEVAKAEPGAGKAWPFVMSWTGRISALIGLGASLVGGVTWFINHHRATVERQEKMRLAETQAKQREYQASIQSYSEILKTDPLYQPALDEQLATTMQWVESPSHFDAASLDQIMAILDAGLSRNRNTARAADILAHIGWTHWLNQKIAEREFGPAAEQSFNTALAADPSNVYANAMLGNWMLQNGKSFAEGIQHLNAAAATGKERPFVRRMQLGALIYLDQPGSRAEQVKVANDMRKDGEPLDEGDKSRILSFCFNPGTTEHKELAESLSAVPPDEAWQTYLWLDDNAKDDDSRQNIHDFIQANLLEVSGKRSDALEKYRLLQKNLKNESGSMKDSVNAAIARLSRS